MKRFTQLSVLTLSIIAISLSFYSVARSAQSSQTVCATTTDPFCYAPLLNTAPSRLDAVSIPKIATPAWLSTQGLQSQIPVTHEVKYMIASKGAISANLDEFASQLNQTLNNSQGWAQLGIRFERVESGGQFTAWLTEASQVPSFSPSGCDTVVSCTVGNNIVINETRWLNGSDAWNASGGSLRDYRHMVVNHETGHWLGHGHEYCSGAGQPAPVMQQQTIDMQGCTPNPWPQPQELFAPKLGIRS